MSPRNAMSARVGVIMMVVALAAACRGIIGIEDLTVAADAGPDGSTAADAGVDARGDGGLESVIDACEKDPSCTTCCGRELPTALAALKGLVGPGTGACACGPPDAAPACGTECGGVQTVCPSSPVPAGGADEPRCERCLADKLVDDVRCQGAEDNCSGSTACRPLVLCLSRCP